MYGFIMIVFFPIALTPRLVEKWIHTEYIMNHIKAIAKDMFCVRIVLKNMTQSDVLHVEGVWYVLHRLLQYIKVQYLFLNMTFSDTILH